MEKCFVMLPLMFDLFIFHLHTNIMDTHFYSSYPMLMLAVPHSWQN